MNILHFIIMLIGVSILLYLGLKNSGSVAQIFNSGLPQVNNTIKTLQGR